LSVARVLILLLIIEDFEKFSRSGSYAPSNMVEVLAVWPVLVNTGAWPAVFGQYSSVKQNGGNDFQPEKGASK
jgi:hypothetical protein